MSVNNIKKIIKPYFLWLNLYNIFFIFRKKSVKAIIQVICLFKFDINIKKIRIFFVSQDKCVLEAGSAPKKVRT